MQLHAPIKCVLPLFGEAKTMNLTSWNTKAPNGDATADIGEKSPLNDCYYDSLCKGDDGW